MDEVKRSGNVIQFRVARRLPTGSASTASPSLQQPRQQAPSQGPMESVRPKLSVARSQSMPSSLPQPTVLAAAPSRPPLVQQSAQNMATFAAAPHAPATAPVWGHNSVSQPRPAVEHLLASHAVTTAPFKPPSPPRTSSLSPASSPKLLRRNQSAPIPAPPPPPLGYVPALRQTSAGAVLPSASAAPVARPAMVRCD